MKYIASVNRSAVPGDEDAAGFDALFPAPGGEHDAKAGRQDDLPGLAFESDDGAAGPEGFHGEGGEFSDPDAGRGDGLHDMEDLFPAFYSGRMQESFEFRIGEIAFRGAEGGSLYAEGRDAALAPVHVGQEGIEGRQHGIGAVYLVFFLQILFILYDAYFIEGRFFPKPLAEGLYVPKVFVDSYVAPFMIPEHFHKCSYMFFINRVLH